MKMHMKILCVFVLFTGCYWYSLYQPVLSSSFDARKQVTTSSNAVQSQGGKRRKFISNKLWRDDAPKNLEIEDNAIVHVKTLTDQEYEVELGLKLLEEAAEVQTAPNRQELISEIGDVYEVLDCIIAHYGLSRQEIEQIRDAKRAKRGSYLKRQYVTYAEYVPDGFMVPYCLNQPEKYQEILD